MSKSAMPVSKAKTAYGLLGEIRKLILEEPKRYNQERTLQRRAKGDGAPACGTVGCVAGWTVALKAPRTPTYDVLEKAANILGLQYSTQFWSVSDELFSGDAAGWREGEGIQQHARNGAKHIAEFMKTHEAQLKAKKV